MANCDTTQKSGVWRSIARFAPAYLFSYFLQTLYGMADLFIIGRYGGAADTTAVAVGSQVMHMLTVMLVGLAMGTTVLIARAAGAKNDAAMRRAIKNLPWKPTLLIVSQRTVSIEHADKILVLDDGELAGIGTHEELLSKKGRYYKLYTGMLELD